MSITTKVGDFTINVDGTVEVTLFSDLYADRGQTSPITYKTDIETLQNVIDQFKELRFSASI